MALLRPFAAGRLLGPLLDHPDLGTRSAAIAALLPLEQQSGSAGLRCLVLQAQRQLSQDERDIVDALLMKKTRDIEVALGDRKSVV